MFNARTGLIEGIMSTAPRLGRDSDFVYVNQKGGGCYVSLWCPDRGCGKWYKPKELDGVFSITTVPVPTYDPAQMSDAPTSF